MYNSRDSKNRFLTGRILNMHLIIRLITCKITYTSSKIGFIQEGRCLTVISHGFERIWNKKIGPEVAFSHFPPQQLDCHFNTKRKCINVCMEIVVKLHSKLMN